MQFSKQEIVTINLKIPKSYIVVIRNIGRTTSTISLFNGRFDCYVLKKLIAKFQHHVLVSEILRSFIVLATLNLKNTLNISIGGLCV